MKKEMANRAVAIGTAVLLVGFAGWAGPRFVISEPVAGQLVVEDTVTGLIWQGCSAGLSGLDCTIGSQALYTWHEAMGYCSMLVWGGHDDWALPELKELRSIVDNRVYSPAINQAMFPKTGVDTWYWSSTVDANYPSASWFVSFYSGGVNGGVKDSTQYVRCVRRGP